MSAKILQVGRQSKLFFMSFWVKGSSAEQIGALGIKSKKKL